MTPRWMVICDEDFGRTTNLSRVSDLFESEGEADFAAEQKIKGGSRLCYVFKLDSVYVPGNSRFVRINHVELESVKESGGFLSGNGPYN